MGQPLSKEEEESAIKELRGLSQGTKGWLNHHFKNELQKMFSPDEKIREKSIDHILEDLKIINC